MAQYTIAKGTKEDVVSSPELLSAPAESISSRRRRSWA